MARSLQATFEQERPLPTDDAATMWQNPHHEPFRRFHHDFEGYTSRNSFGSYTTRSESSRKPSRYGRRYMWGSKMGQSYIGTGQTQRMSVLAARLCLSFFPYKSRRSQVHSRVTYLPGLREWDWEALVFELAHKNTTNAADRSNLLDEEMLMLNFTISPFPMFNAISYLRADLGGSVHRPEYGHIYQERLEHIAPEHSKLLLRVECPQTTKTILGVTIYSDQKPSMDCKWCFNPFKRPWVHVNEEEETKYNLGFVIDRHVKVSQNSALITESGKGQGENQHCEQELRGNSNQGGNRTTYTRDNSVPKEMKPLGRFVCPRASIDFNDTAEIVACNNGSKKRRPSSTLRSHPRSDSQLQNSKRRKTKVKGDRGSDDEGSGKTPLKPGHGAKVPSKQPRLFACPYYKLNPIKHLNCFKRFNLKRVKDVKQHLHRKHAMPELYCPTCWRTFEHRPDWDQHITERLCSPREPPSADGDIMTREQQKAIATRTNSGLDDCKQWLNIWRTLFPDKAEPESPYLGTELQEVISTVRQYWEQNSNRIVSSILASRRTGTTETDGSLSASPFENITAASESIDRFSAEIFTDTMGILLKQFQDQAQRGADDASISPSSQKPCLDPPHRTSEDDGPEGTDMSVIPIQEDTKDSNSCVWPVQERPETDFFPLPDENLVHMTSEEDWLSVLNLPALEWPELLPAESKREAEN